VTAARCLSTSKPIPIILPEVITVNILHFIRKWQRPLLFLYFTAACVFTEWAVSRAHILESAPGIGVVASICIYGRWLEISIIGEASGIFGWRLIPKEIAAMITVLKKLTLKRVLLFFYFTAVCAYIEVIGPVLWGMPSGRVSRGGLAAFVAVILMKMLIIAAPHPIEGHIGGDYIRKDVTE
jgi:hypothetical protein